MAAATTARADLREPDPDVTPPEVTIVSPSDGALLSADERIVVEVEATDPPPERTGVASVQLLVDGEPLLLNEESPWTFAIGLDHGSYELRAVARDWEGNEGTSEPVMITVEGEDLVSDGATDRGCACTSGGEAGWASGPWGPMMMMVMVPWLRRRRG